MRHIISDRWRNEAGALSRVVGLFSARGYNIETLTVAPTEDATLSRMTIVTSGCIHHPTDHQTSESIDRRWRKWLILSRARTSSVNWMLNEGSRGGEGTRRNERMAISSGVASLTLPKKSTP